MIRHSLHAEAGGTVACAIYARVSTTRQAEENASLSVQLEECRKYAEAQGWAVHREYVDGGISAHLEKRRPSFNAMLDDALTPNPAFQIILVYDHSRFYRNVGQSEVTRFQLGLNGVLVQSVTQPIEDDGLSGSLAITIQAAVDEHHSRITAVKVRSGMAANARAGFYNGGVPPYGYRLEKAEQRGTKTKNRLAIDPAEAEVVKLVFELYEQGLGQSAITTKLNRDVVRTRSGKPWYKSTIAKMLTATTYVGRHPFRPTNWRTRKIVHRSEWIDIPCPPIVDESQFQNVQRLLKERDRRTTPPRLTTSDVLLSKIAVCGSCQGALQLATGTSQNGTVHHYYKCAEKLRTGFCPGGKGVSIPRATLDDLVMDKVAEELLTADRVMDVISRASALQSTTREAASRRIGDLKRLLRAAKRREANLWELAAEGGVKARQGFLDKLDEVQNETGALEHQIVAQEALVATAVKPVTRAQAETKSADMRKLLRDADIRKKRRFFQAVVEKVVVTEDEIEIIGPESTLAEVASGVQIHTNPPVRGSGREWCCR